MTLTNLQIKNLYEALLVLREQADLRLPAKTSFKVLRNLNMIQDTYIALEEARRGIITHYGEPIGNDEFQIPQDKIDEANKELIELSLLESEYDISRIHIDEIEDLPLSFSTIDGLYIIIDGN